MELEQECNNWWWHIYCILHQLCHCWQNSLAHCWIVIDFGDITSVILSCIGFIDETIKIHNLWNNPSHHSWFNGRKKMYCMNNIVVMDHCGLFIYLDLEYPRSYHEYLSPIKHSQIIALVFCSHKWVFWVFYWAILVTWVDMFVMCCIGRRELMFRVHMDVVKVYNKIHACLTSHSILRFGLRFKV